MINRQLTEIIRPARGAMDLDRGALDPKIAIQSAVFTLCGLVVSMLSTLLVLWAIPKELEVWGLIRPVVAVFGSAIAITAALFAFYMGKITINEWVDYIGRKSQWHTVELEAFKQLKGIEVIREYSQLEFRPDRASDMLFLALVKHYEHSRPRATKASPHSVASLSSKIELSVGANSITLGELKGVSPEKVSSLFAELGLVQGRKKNVAGQWVPESYDEVIEQFIKNWHKITNKPKYQEDL